MTVKEQFVSTAIFAVRPTDGVTGAAFLAGSTRVVLQGSGAIARETPGRYYVFTDLAGSTFVATVENANYFSRDVSVHVPALDPRTPVVAVTMMPRYHYPFPAGSTLIRGRVLGPGSAPVAGVVVTVQHSSVTGRTEEDGRFALWFGPLTEDGVAVVGGKRLVKINNATDLRITAEHAGYATATQTIGAVEEGSTLLLKTPITLSP